MMSVASSTTPGIGENSCSTPSNLDGGDGGAFDRRQEHAPQRVADGGAEPALERLRVEAAEPIG
jgi:hypothetical protein